jgi:hypothetical protein
MNSDIERITRTVHMCRRAFWSLCIPHRKLEKWKDLKDRDKSLAISRTNFILKNYPVAMQELTKFLGYDWTEIGDFERTELSLILSITVVLSRIPESKKK